VRDVAISANEKILDLLLLFQRRDGEITIDTISSALNIPKSTAYRYAKTLTDKGFLHKAEASGRYQLGRVFLEFSHIALTNNRRLALAVLPHMTALAAATGESVSMMRVMNHRAVCVETIEGTHALRVAIERGRSQLLHAGASSKVLLAGYPPESWESYLDFPLVEFTETTLTDWDTLQAELHRVRERGYAVSNGEIDIGARAVAVPLVNPLGTVVAALSVEAPASRMDDDRLATVIAQLQEASRTVQVALA
jgi:DNA-binding IclR family transcriptional regulator